MIATRLRAAVSLAIVAMLVALVAAPLTAAKPKGPVDVQLLGINDLHGNLEPPAGSAGRITTSFGPPAQTVDAGGVEYLATHIKTLEATNPNTLVLSAGDLIGASPLVSALFHDEPTIEAMNKIGLDVNAVGNHEFDEGVYELLRMRYGGCHPFDGCQDGDGFEGADFEFLAANVTWKKDGKTIFPAYRIYDFSGVKIAIVGLVTRTTPTIVTPSGISSLDFHDEADTMNALIPQLRRRGVETIIGLIHEGGLPTGLYNECPGISGAIVDIVERTNDEVDLWISGHTHQAYDCLIDGDPVSSGSSFGRIVTDIDMQIDRRSGEPTQLTVDNRIVVRTVAKDADQTALIGKYKTLSAPLANREVGNITANITRTANAAGESALGDFIADSQWFVTKEPAFGGAVVAFMNAGGIRADLLFPKVGPEAVDGIVRYEEIFTVQPFGNSLVTMTLTGAQIDTLLEQQFDNPVAGQSRILQVSDTLRYSWSASAPTGSKVDIASITIGGTPISATASYRVTVNSFLADGGDNFLVLKEGTNRLGGEVDLDAVEKYFDAQSGPVAPPAQNRITRLP